MLWLTKKLTIYGIKPNYRDNNELLDFLSRIPTIPDLNRFKAETVQQIDSDSEDDMDGDQSDADVDEWAHKYITNVNLWLSAFSLQISYFLLYTETSIIKTKHSRNKLFYAIPEVQVLNLKIQRKSFANLNILIKIL